MRTLRPGETSWHSSLRRNPRRSRIVSRQRPGHIVGTFDEEGGEELLSRVAFTRLEVKFGRRRQHIGLVDQHRGGKISRLSNDERREKFLCAGNGALLVFVFLVNNSPGVRVEKDRTFRRDDWLLRLQRGRSDKQSEKENRRQHLHRAGQ